MMNAGDGSGGGNFPSGGGGHFPAGGYPGNGPGGQGTPIPAGFAPNTNGTFSDTEMLHILKERYEQALMRRGHIDSGPVTLNEADCSFPRGIVTPYRNIDPVVRTLVELRNTTWGLFDLKRPSTTCIDKIIAHYASIAT